MKRNYRDKLYLMSKKTVNFITIMIIYVLTRHLTVFISQLIFRGYKWKCLGSSVYKLRIMMLIC